MGLKYDNERDRNSYGYDAGQIVDGTVAYDEDRREFVLVDDEGIAFSSQHFLQSQLGKKVRLTCVSFEALETIEQMMKESQPEAAEVDLITET